MYIYFFSLRKFFFSLRNFFMFLVSQGVKSLLIIVIDISKEVFLNQKKKAILTILSIGPTETSKHCEFSMTPVIIISTREIKY